MWLNPGSPPQIQEHFKVRIGRSPVGAMLIQCPVEGVTEAMTQKITGWEIASQPKF